MQTLDSALTRILSGHLNGQPIDHAVWQNLDNADRVQISEAIVAGKRANPTDVRVFSYDIEWPYWFTRIADELRA
jgi:hypothetical protein